MRSRTLSVGALRQALNAYLAPGAYTVPAWSKHDAWTLEMNGEAILSFATFWELLAVAKAIDPATGWAHRRAA